MEADAETFERQVVDIAKKANDLWLMVATTLLTDLQKLVDALLEREHNRKAE